MILFYSWPVSFLIFVWKLMGMGKKDEKYMIDNYDYELSCK